MNNYFQRRRAKLAGGYVLILNALIFLAISFFIIGAIIAPLVASNRATRAHIASTQSFMLAGSASEEALYKLKNQMNLASSETLTLQSGEAQITVATGLDGKTVQVQSDVDDYVRAIHVRLTEHTGVSFNYGLQAGRGGFEMSGGAQINGNVYSNGNIVGSGAPIITGGATVANGADPVADQSNSGPATPSQSISFGANNTPQDVAQSFHVATTTPVTSVRVYMKKSTNNWMNNITVRLTTDNGGKPSKTTLASANLGAQQITTSYNYLTIPFSSTPSLNPGTPYWIVFDTNTTWGSQYSLAATSNTYADGVGKTGSWASSNGGTWSDTSPSGLDAYFDLYVGGETGLISGIYIGQSGGDAWAHEVVNSHMYGNLYCQASSGTNKACDTSRPGATQQPFPISDGNINDWKSEALAGGVTVGNISYSGADVDTLGPQKIEGNLTVGAGATLNVSGTLWVTGNVSVTGGAVIRLADSYGNASGVIVTDGRVTASGGGQYQGNGLSGSYILMITTSTCPVGSCGGNNPAVSVTGGTGAVILNAQKGTITFNGGAQAKQATAEKIIMTGGTTVNYETGLADINFSSGPSGSWTIEEWDEI